tara:strand:+ start:321 stop:668 length:348 start_codon:yes stop_codon:yes gene_type:complete
MRFIIVSEEIPCSSGVLLGNDDWFSAISGSFSSVLDLQKVNVGMMQKPIAPLLKCLMKILRLVMIVVVDYLIEGIICFYKNPEARSTPFSSALCLKLGLCDSRNSDIPDAAGVAI